MLTPEELSHKPFTKVLRGYSAEEVDSYIDFLLEKYNEARRENDELRSKVDLALQKLELLAHLPPDREAKRLTAAAREESRRITAEANLRAERILTSVKTRCAEEISAAQRRVEEEQAALAKMRDAVVAFRDSIYAEYMEHIKQLEKIQKRAAELAEPVDISGTVTTKLASDMRAWEETDKARAAERAQNEGGDYASDDDSKTDGGAQERGATASSTRPTRRKRRRIV